MFSTHAVVKIFDHKRKPDEQISAVQRMHTMGGIGRLTWEEAPRCKVLPPWSIKGREGHM